MSNLPTSNWKKVNVDDLVSYLTESLGHILFFRFHRLCVGSPLKTNFSVIVLHLILSAGLNNLVSNIPVTEQLRY